MYVPLCFESRATKIFHEGFLETFAIVFDHISELQQLLLPVGYGSKFA